MSLRTFLLTPLTIPLTKLGKIFHQPFSLRDQEGKTCFHVACCSGFSKVVDLLITNSIDLKIDLNAKYRMWGWTGFYLGG